MSEKPCFAPISRKAILPISPERLTFLWSSLAFSGLPKPACAYIASGKRTINPSRFGICTLGNVCALIVSFSPISLFCAKI